VGKLGRMLANFGAMHFEGTLDDEKISPFMQQKAELNEAIERKRSILRHPSLSIWSMTNLPILNILGVIHGINRQQHQSAFLAATHHAMARVRVIPSRLLSSASVACTSV